MNQLADLWSRVSVQTMSPSRKLVPSLLAGLAILLPAASSFAQCSDPVRFEPGAQLSASAISKLSAEVTNSEVETSGGGIIAFWQFDSEDQPVRGAWAASAIVYATTGSIGDGNPAGVLWVRANQDRHAPSRVRTIRLADGIAMHVTQPALSRACRGDFVVTRTNRGTLRADGVLVGALR